MKDKKDTLLIRQANLKKHPAEVGGLYHQSIVPPEEGTNIAFGDLHGNALKFLYMLIDRGVLHVKPETYEQLRILYNRATRYEVKTRYDSIDHCELHFLSPYPESFEKTKCDRYITDEVTLYFIKAEQIEPQKIAFKDGFFLHNLLENVTLPAKQSSRKLTREDRQKIDEYTGHKAHQTNTIYINSNQFNLAAMPMKIDFIKPNQFYVLGAPYGFVEVAEGLPIIQPKRIQFFIQGDKLFVWNPLDSEKRELPIQDKELFNTLKASLHDKDAFYEATQDDLERIEKCTGERQDVVCYAFLTPERLYFGSISRSQLPESFPLSTYDIRGLGFEDAHYKAMIESCPHQEHLLEKSGLEYEVIGPDGQFREGIISWDRLPKGFPRDNDGIYLESQTANGVVHEALVKQVSEDISSNYPAPPPPLQFESAQDYRQFWDLLNSAKINSNASLILIGDEAFDRGNDDFLTMQIIMLLSNKKDFYFDDIVISNHGTEFLLDYERKSFTGNSITIPGLINRASALNMKYFIDKGFIDEQELRKVIAKYYIPKIKAISYTISPEGDINLYTHAPVGFETIKALAGAFGVSYNDETKEALILTIDLINSALQEHLQNGKLTPILAKEQEALKSTQSESERRIGGSQNRSLIAPLTRLIENRKLGNEFRANPYRGNYKVTFNYGHVGSSPVLKGQDPNSLEEGSEVTSTHHNTDNDFGKLNDTEFSTKPYVTCETQAWTAKQLAKMYEEGKDFDNPTVRNIALILHKYPHDQLKAADRILEVIAQQKTISTRTPASRIFNIKKLAEEIRREPWNIGENAEKLVQIDAYARAALKVREEVEDGPKSSQTSKSSIQSSFFKIGRSLGLEYQSINLYKKISEATELAPKVLPMKEHVKMEAPPKRSKEEDKMEEQGISDIEFQIDTDKEDSKPPSLGC